MVLNDTANLKNPRWGRSRSSQAKKRERILLEKARSEKPLRRAPMLMSGSIDLHHSPETAVARNPKVGFVLAGGRGGCGQREAVDVAANGGVIFFYFL